MVKKLISILLFIIILALFSMTVYAEEDTMPDEYEDLLDSIPDDTVDRLPDGIFSEDPDDVIEGVEEITSWEYLFNMFFDILGLNFQKIIRVFAILCSLLVLSSLLNMIKQSISNQGLESILNLVGSAVIVATILEVSKEPLSRTMILFEELKIFVNTMSPLVCGMYAMGGNVASAIVNNYGLIVFLSILENICIIALQMILGVCMALTLASSFINGTNLIPLNNAIKKTFTFFLGFIMLVFTTVISTQTLLASKADSLSSKTAKMLAMQMIPLVGGTVGESLRTAGASIEYLRSNVGVVLIIILVVMIMPTLISISLYRLVFIVSNAVAGLLGCEREGKMILEISSIYGYVLAILSICSVILLFLITVFAKCSSPLS